METTTEIKARKAKYGGNKYNDNIEEIGNLIFANEITLEGFEVDEGVHADTFANSQGASSSTVRRQTKKDLEDNTSMSDIAKTFQKNGLHV